ncbi:MAG: hypothetical protein H7252_09100 [Cytophaga sp.]|nr:hypothetical protein [Undibacterium sp.]
MSSKINSMCVLSVHSLFTGVNQDAFAKKANVVMTVTATISLTCSVGAWSLAFGVYERY